MSDQIDDKMLSDWRINYGLDTCTPAEAMRWWHDSMDGKAPAGAVAALGLCIDEIERLRAENEVLREIERDVSNALPGVYYMDPPDGGSVPLGEQVRRMAVDAARYRLLRRKFAIISDGEGHAEFCAINLPRPTYIAPNTAIELDAALDRERLGMDGAKRPPTPVGWSDTDWIKHLQEQPRPVRHNQTEQEE